MTRVIDTVEVRLGRDPGPWRCVVCGVPAVVRLNTSGACASHLDRVMTEEFAPLYRLIGQLVWGLRADDNGQT